MNIDLKSYIVDVPDFPKPGIVFKDITPVLQSSQAFNAAIDALAAWAGPRKPEIIAGIESRGFLFAAALARDLRLGLTVIRKKGKLPRKCEMHEDAVARGQRVLIIDDLIATGSSSVSAISLVELVQGEVVGFGAIVELSFLNGLEAIRKAHPDVPVHALVRY
jgi:adenine phosphoribosyltransferase